MTLFPASDNGLRPRWEKLRHRAGKGFGKLQKLAVANPTCSAFDLCNGITPNVPAPTLAGGGKRGLAHAASYPQPANLRPDDVLCVGRHCAESST
jgi:hypothetical protein